MAIKFFGASDRKDKKATGVIRSEYPHWYHPVREDMLAEEVANMQRKIDMGIIDNLPNNTEWNMEFERKKALLDEIQNDKPNFNDADKDAVFKVYKSLGKKITELMPTHTDMQKGLANAHDENRKDTIPCIPVRGMTDVVRECGVTPIDGMITRKQATRVWKISGRSLNEPSNVEHLRRDFRTGTYQSERSIRQMERDDN
jgi:hypothetical protein